jgi:hypothetical protein
MVRQAQAVRHVALATTVPSVTLVQHVMTATPAVRAPRATARVQIVRALTARIGHAPIALTATSHAVSGSPMGESVVRSARR